MNLSVVPALMLVALSAFSETRQAPIAPIALYAKFEESAPEGVIDSLHDELENIMAHMGFQFDWRRLDGVRGNEVTVELAVITFKGHCDVAGLTSRASTPGPLGWTHVSDGVILPFSDVDCDRIRGFVQKELLSLRAEEREVVMGRALGRVVAHELYHIFANTSRHGSCGVGKAAYTVQELLSPDFQFEARETEALRT